MLNLILAQDDRCVNTEKVEIIIKDEQQTSDVISALMKRHTLSPPKWLINKVNSDYEEEHLLLLF